MFLTFSDLAFALSNRNVSQEFHVLVILIILVTTIFFCHALIRLCMMIINPPADDDLEGQNPPSRIGPGGYANPQEPIRVALARDEEAVGIESVATKIPPPAYGLWRESVVCGCNLSPLLQVHSILISSSEWIPIASSGNATRQHYSVKTVSPKSGLRRQTDRLHTSLRTGSIMWLKHSRGRLHPQLMCLYHHTLPKEDDFLSSYDGNRRKSRS